jgi:mannose/fructose/N-acetylgalactosamine-specific phosphotransferase system component IIB
MVDLPSYKHFEDSYYLDWVMAEREVDLTSAGRVENFDFVEEVVVVVDMAMITVDFDLEIGELADSERMEDIDRIGQISHKDFACFATMLEKHFEFEAKVVAKDSNLVGIENS